MSSVMKRGSVAIGHSFDHEMCNEEVWKKCGRSVAIFDHEMSSVKGMI